MRDTAHAGSSGTSCVCRRGGVKWSDVMWEGLTRCAASSMWVGEWWTVGWGWDLEDRPQLKAIGGNVCVVVLWNNSKRIACLRPNERSGCFQWKILWKYNGKTLFLLIVSFLTWRWVYFQLWIIRKILLTGSCLISYQIQFMLNINIIMTYPEPSSISQ